MSEPTPATSPTLLPPPRRAAIRRNSSLARLRPKVRDFFRRERLREFVSTLALVAPLTVLVWVWAEREQAVDVPVKKLFGIAVTSSIPGKTVALAPGQPDTVTVEMTGPRAGVEGIRDAIAKDLSKARLVIDVSRDYDPGGPYTLPLESILDQQKIFIDYGVTITSSEPANLSINVDRRVERDVPVKLPAEIAASVQTATFEPKSVKIRGPERVIKQLEANSELRAELELSNPTELRSRGTRSISLPNVPLRAIAAQGVTFDTPTITSVTLTLSQEEPAELKPVYVFISQPAGLKVKTTVNQLVVSGVRVIGPNDALRQLREGKVVPQAVLTITRDDQGKRGERTPVIQNLPAGVRVDEASVPSVTFDVSADTAAAGDGTLAP